MPEAAAQLAAEGWTVIEADEDVAVEPSHSAGSQARRRERSATVPARLSLMLQLSKFPWGEDPVTWLASVADAARSRPG